MPRFPLIEVRPYHPSDLDGVIDLFQRAVRETASADYNEAQIAAWAQADRDEWELARLNRPTWVGLVDGELAGLDDPKKPTDETTHPLAWYHEYDGGRSWNTTLGHRKEAYADPIFRQHILGGILWVLQRPSR